jgi:hypothetical protein
MLALKYLLVVAGALSLAVAGGIALFDVWLKFTYERKLARGAEELTAPSEIRWKASLALAIAACMPLLIGFSIVVVPTGTGGVRISQLRGTLPGTLYSGVHFVSPLTESVATFDLRDKLFTTGSTLEDGSPAASAKSLAFSKGAMDVQSKEGLIIGLGVTIRYRLDPRKLDYIQSHLPQPVDAQIVPAVAASGVAGTGEKAGA